MRLIRKLSALLLCIQLAGAPAMNCVHAQMNSGITEQTVCLAEEEHETDDPSDSEYQRRNAVMYLLPSVVIAVVLTVIVMRQKKENRNR